MNILYITYLYGLKWTGPNYSVPSQINAQAKYDNVFWYNINNLYKEEQSEGIKCYDIDDFPNLKITELPDPFNSPDLVIFEGLYFYSYCKIANECRKKGIPYIIIPRSSLTSYAQKSKFLKKKVANTLFFKNFIRKATAIQYLTSKEYRDSGDSWNKTHFIIPNGISGKSKIRQFTRREFCKGVFIGRLDIYQKGIDLLIEACSNLKEELEKENIIIEIYGPDKEGSKSEIKKMIDDNNLGCIINLKEAVFDIEKEEILLNSDFFILTSRFEGHPMGLIEALSFGLPCLITEGTNMADDVKQADAGWTAGITSESLTTEFKNLLNDRGAFASKGRNALKLSNLYNWNKLADDSSDIYHQLLNKVQGKKDNEKYY
ncbi:glycosyltransferase [Cytobacillus sp. FSL R7-0680]|uniref:glycosyltransferase n=1 Tax=Cytobacillus sp. FSL R7-0680 TaxID=2921689 RepID=UPI0030F6DDE8